MIKLLKIASTKDMLELEIAGKRTWVSCPSNVKSYAVQNLKLGDEVNISSEQKSTGLFVNSISKKGLSNPQQTTNAPTQSAESVVGGSGPSTNTPPPVTQPAQERSSTGKYRDPLTPEESRSIRHQSTMTSACHAVLTVQTQIDPKDLADYVISVYRKLLAAIEEK